MCRPLGVPQWITPTNSCATGACCGSETPSHTTHAAACCPAMHGTCRHLSSPYLPLVTVPATSVGAFLHHIGLWSAPSVGRAICLLPRLFACYAVACKSVACPHRLSSASRLARLPPVPPAASVACPRRLSSVSLPYHVAATRRRIELLYRCRTMSPQRAAVSSRGISAVTCSRNAPPYRAAVSYRRNIAAISSADCPAKIERK